MSGVETLLRIARGHWNPTEVRVEAVKALGRTDSVAVGEALADVAQAHWNPVELRTAAARAAGRVLNGSKRRR